MPVLFLLVDDVDWEDAESVVCLNGAGSAELSVDALGHARKDACHRVRAGGRVRLDKLRNLQIVH